MRAALTFGALAVATVGAVSLLLPDGQGAGAPPQSIDLGVRTPDPAGAPPPRAVTAPTDVPQAVVPAPQPAPVPAAADARPDAQGGDDVDDRFDVDDADDDALEPDDDALEPDDDGDDSDDDPDDD